MSIPAARSHLAPHRRGGRERGASSHRASASTSALAPAAASVSNNAPVGAGHQLAERNRTMLAQIHRVLVDSDNGGAHMKDAAPSLAKAADLRKKYKSVDKGQMESDERLDVGAVQLQVRSDGVIFFEGQTTNVIAWEEYYDDVMTLINANSKPDCIATCRGRLQVLEEKYKLHCLLNSDFEEHVDRSRRGGGIFGHATRVDNYVKLQAGMNAQTLVQYVRQMCEYRGQDVVRVPGMGEQTLRGLLDNLDFTEQQLTVEGLGLHPSAEKRFTRFDVFDADVNKGGKSAATLLHVFLSRDASTHGRLFAEVIRPLLFPTASGAVAEVAGNSSTPGGQLSYIPTTDPLGHHTMSVPSLPTVSPYASSASLGGGAHPVPSPVVPLSSSAAGAALRPSEATEYAIPVYGNADDEWSQLARFLQHHRLTNPSRNMFIIEIPRVALMRKSFPFDVNQQQLERLFLPLFLATRSPEDDKYSDIAWLLRHVGAFTIRSDEDSRPSPFTKRRRPPGDIPWNECPCDLYFAYYFWANLASLNSFRKRRGLNTFEMRASAGERPSQLDSLLYSYLLCDSVSHGVLLDEHPVLQYLYGMNSVGISMSPLTNNGTDVEYVNNPFKKFFFRSLNVSLCTDSPLHYHHYDDPLLEEYSTASKILRLSPVDLSEISRNSVIMSSFPSKMKTEWLGTPDYETVNVQMKSCVPDTRIAVRRHLWEVEKALIETRKIQAERRRLSQAGRTDGGLDVSLLGGSALTSDPELEASRRRSIVSIFQDETLTDELRLTAKEAALSEAKYGYAAGGKFRLLPGSSATEKLAIYVTVDMKVDYPRIKFVGPTERDAHRTSAAKMLRRALQLRQSYVFTVDSWKRVTRSIETVFSQGGNNTNSTFDESAWEYGHLDGVVVLKGRQKMPRLPSTIHTYEDFVKHHADLKEIVDSIHVKKLAYRRLNVLEDRFRLHHAVSSSVEASNSEEKQSSNRDFYQTNKVDTNVHMETGMTARQLLNFILSKAHHSADDIVCHKEGTMPQTLRQLLNEQHIDPTHLTVDDLNVQVDNSVGINEMAFTPEGRDQLLTLLLKTDNEMKGRYFAELTKLTFEQFKRDSFTFAENRLPIYGANKDEWNNLSNWFDTHGMACFNNQWMIQIPRIYSYLYRNDKVTSFANYLENIFLPLWEVSLHPRKEPRLFHFLNHISGFDCVEDERRQDMIVREKVAPQDWNHGREPPYSYYMYYIWANLRTLNEFRQSRGFSTFTFRPSCGEAGSLDHLLTGFMLSNSINFGVGLRNDPALQYLYYLAQIGIAVSPLSNNTKLLEYLENPFPVLFRRGLDVSLSTDSPLQYHHTQEPLIEEYSIASKVWKLSPTDMCEVARNSVRQSGFGHEFKSQKLGSLYYLSSSVGNDETKTHLSSVRVAYRWETYHTEVSLLEHMTGEQFPRAMLTAEQETALIEEASKSRPNDEVKGIIAASTDNAAMDRLRAQRDELTKKLQDINNKVEEHREHHRMLSDRYHEAVSREQELAELRKTRKAELEAHMATAQAALNAAAAVSGPQGGNSTSAGSEQITRQPSFAASLNRRASNGSLADLARVQSTVTSHLGRDDTTGSQFDDDIDDGSRSVHSLSTNAQLQQPARELRMATVMMGSETPWTSGTLFSQPTSSEGTAATAKNARVGFKANAPSSTSATASSTAAGIGVDEDVQLNTERILARIAQTYIPPAQGSAQGGAAQQATSGRQQSQAGVTLAPRSAKLTTGGVTASAGGTATGPSGALPPAPPPRR